MVAVSASLSDRHCDRRRRRRGRTVPPGRENSPESTSQGVRVSLAAPAPGRPAPGPGPGPQPQAGTELQVRG